MLEITSFQDCTCPSCREFLIERFWRLRGADPCSMHSALAYEHQLAAGLLFLCCCSAQLLCHWVRTYCLICGVPDLLGCCEVWEGVACGDHGLAARLHRHHDVAHRYACLGEGKFC
ncbi:Protein of unknown function [Gryllus bimaculatus]|nr:Protein of unknown function [Gryllus bimaculatus]